MTKGTVKYAVLVVRGPFFRGGGVLALGGLVKFGDVFAETRQFSRRRGKHEALHETVCTLDTSALAFRSNGSMFISPFEIPSVSLAIEVLALVQSLRSQLSDPTSPFESQGPEHLKVNGGGLFWKCGPSVFFFFLLPDAFPVTAVLLF